MKAGLCFIMAHDQGNRNSEKISPLLDEDMELWGRIERVYPFFFVLDKVISEKQIASQVLHVSLPQKNA